MHRFVATCAPGLEEALAEELRELGVGACEALPRAVAFEGPLALGLRACLWSRVASRLLLVLREIYAADARCLYTEVRALDWSAHLGPDHTLAVSFTGRSEALRDERFSALKVKDAIVDRLRNDLGRRPSVSRDDPDVRVHVHLHNRRATVCVDLSGDPLHLRWADRDGGPAPLKQSLAAGILRAAGWPALAREGAHLVDPFCGSGTFLVEAAGMLRDEAPGLARSLGPRPPGARSRWGFARWRGFDEALWTPLVEEARDRVRSVAEARVHGSDRDPAQLARARHNLTGMGILDEVSLRLAPVEAARPKGERPGLVVTNPPYGERLGEGEDLAQTWRALGDVLRWQFPGWTAFILAGAREPARHLGLRPASRRPLFQGALDARLLEVPISPEPPRPRTPG